LETYNIQYFEDLKTQFENKTKWLEQVKAIETSVELLKNFSSQTELLNIWISHFEQICLPSYCNLFNNPRSTLIKNVCESVPTFVASLPEDSPVIPQIAKSIFVLLKNSKAAFYEPADKALKVIIERKLKFEVILPAFIIGFNDIHPAIRSYNGDYLLITLQQNVTEVEPILMQLKDVVISRVSDNDADVRKSAFSVLEFFIDHFPGFVLLEMKPNIPENKWRFLPEDKKDKILSMEPNNNSPTNEVI